MTLTFSFPLPSAISVSLPFPAGCARSKAHICPQHLGLTGPACSSGWVGPHTYLTTCLGTWFPNSGVQLSPEGCFLSARTPWRAQGLNVMLSLTVLSPGWGGKGSTCGCSDSPPEPPQSCFLGAEGTLKQQKRTGFSGWLAVETGVPSCSGRTRPSGPSGSRLWHEPRPRRVINH